MNYELFFSELSDDQLRDKADDTYADLLDAATLDPQSKWHEACFAAMYAASQEMCRRKMPPPTAKVLQ